MNITFLKSFLKDIKKIKNKEVKLKLEEFIIEIEKATSLEEVKNISKLKGYTIAYRAKINDYRVGIYKYNEFIELARFVKREDIYKVFPKK